MNPQQPLEARVSTQERRMNNLETRIEEMYRDMLASFKQLSTYLGTFEDRFDTVEKDIRDIRATMATKDDLAIMQGDITNIKRDIGVMQGDIINIKGDIGDIRATMATKEDIAHIREAMATKGDIVNIQRDMSDMRATMATKEDIAHIREAMATKEDIVKIREGTEIYNRNILLLFSQVLERIPKSQ